MEEKKVSKYEGKRIISPVTTGFGVANFPISLFEEWEADCNLYFNGCYWMKMWSDHLRSKNKEMEESLAKKMMEEAQPEKKVEKPEKEYVETFGGKQYVD